MSERLEKIIPQLLTKIDFKEGMRNFKKKYYEDFFNEYRNRTEEVNKEIVAMYDSADKDEEMQSAALALISYAKNEYDKAGMFKKTTKAHGYAVHDGFLRASVSFIKRTPG